ncbi:caspase family protein [Streptomyces sp. NPDC093250]|uniref:caspase, EACC1-associated type n=1 Tax=Streptomyces sp. NPDC093250 TaxID=3366036 RepID=UPI0037F394AD
MSGGRFALLVATGRYENPSLRRLRSPSRDADGLEQVLRDPRIGDFDVRTLVDGPHHEVTRAIEDFFLDRRRDDLLLLHLSCHGLKDDNGELHFAAADTDRRLLASTSVSAAFLHTQMRRCRARSIVLLLDCCYSGAFLPGGKGDTTVHIQDELAGHGRVVITATNRTEYAWEGERLSELDPEPSRFTGAVIEGLRTGEADRNADGLIGVDELYDYVYERLQAGRVAQRPQMWAQLENRVVVARSVLRSRPPDRGDDEAATPHPLPPGRESAHVPPRTEGPPGRRPRAALGEMVSLTEAMCGLPCMEDARSRALFATVLGDHLGRRVDVRGVRLRMDAVTLVRAAQQVPGGLHVLLLVIEVFEGRAVAMDVRGRLERDDAARLALSHSPSPDGAYEPPSEAELGGLGRLLGLRTLVRLTEAMCELSCMEDGPNRMQFAAALGQQLGRPVDVRGVRLREDVVSILRPVLAVEGGERTLMEVVRVFEGDREADELGRRALATD